MGRVRHACSKSRQCSKSRKRWDILHLLIDGLWVSAKAAGSGIFKRYLDVIVSLALLIIAAPASAAPLVGQVAHLEQYGTTTGRFGCCMVERESSALDARDAIKRVIDVLGASLLIVLFAPLMALIALIVKRSSPGPAIFPHRRLGLGGREFVATSSAPWCANADKLLLNSPELQRQFFDGFKLKEDPRLTPVGGIDTKTSLDELPQLFNVLGAHEPDRPPPHAPAGSWTQRMDCYGSSHGRAAPFGQARARGSLAGSAGEATRPTSERIAMDMDYISQQFNRCWT